MKLWNRSRRVLLAVVALIALSVAVPAGASAGGTGTTLLSAYGFQVGAKKYSFPGGTLEITIDGSGYTANLQRGRVIKASTICYGRITFTERGAGDALLRSSNGSTVQGCLNGEQARTRYNYTFSNTTRKACTTLYLNDVYQNAACLAIY